MADRGREANPPASFECPGQTRLEAPLRLHPSGAFKCTHDVPSLTAWSGEYFYPGEGSSRRTGTVTLRPGLAYLGDAAAFAWAVSGRGATSTQWDDIDGSDSELNPMMVPTANPALRGGRRLDFGLGIQAFASHVIIRNPIRLELRTVE